MATIPIGNRPLERDHLARLVGRRAPRLELDEGVAGRVRASRRVVDEAMRDGRVCYGINTGFGRMAQTVVAAKDLRPLQVNLVRSHAVGVGEPLPLSTARLAFALRLVNLAQGFSGVRLKLLEHGLAVFNASVVPVVPSQGSVGASGDLAPLAHMALVLLGEGRAWHRARQVDGAVALERAGLKPLRLHSKEGLALLNGTQVSTAILTEAWLLARRLAATADIAAALSLEAYGGTATAFDERIHALRPHPGQVRTAANLRGLLAGSEVLPSHADCDRVQDHYSLRCVPQVHGATRDALGHVERVVLTEVNAVTDNPLVFSGGDVLSGGNFHAQPVAVAADLLKIGVCELASISERRMELLLNPDVSGLPAFLAHKQGLESGLMIAQVAAAALVSENKVLAHPASVDSIPTSAGKEDHVSMATHGARHARMVVDNVTRVLAIELMTGFHALAFQTRHRPGHGVEAAREHLSTVLRPLTRDRVLAPDIEAVAELVRDGSLVDAVEAVVGPLA